MPLDLTGSADSIYNSVLSSAPGTTRTSLDWGGWLRGCRAWGAVVGLLEGNGPECQPTDLERAGEPRVRDARAPRWSWPGWGPAVCRLSPRLPDSEAPLFPMPQPLASRSPWQADLVPAEGRGQAREKEPGHRSPRAFSLPSLWHVRSGPSLCLSRTYSPKRSHSPRALPRVLGDAVVTQPGAWGSADAAESRRGPHVLRAAAGSRVLESDKSVK